MPEPENQFLDFLFVDHQRRAERYCVADGAQDDAMCFGAIRAICADLICRIECLAGRFVANELDARNQPLAADFADKRMIQKFLRPPRKCGSIARTCSTMFSSS